LELIPYKPLNRINPKVAIILIQANQDTDDLIECLDSLNKIKYDNFYIVLVNNGVKDLKFKTLLIDYQYKFKMIFLRTNKNLGFAGGCNVGIKRALLEKPDFIYLLNSDTIVDEFFLINLIKFISNRKKIELLGPVIMSCLDNKIESTGGLINIWRGEAPLINSKKEIDDLKGNYQKVDYISGCALLIHSEIFKIVGLLNEEYFPGYYEDTEFCYRAKKQGIDSVCVFNSKIWHKGSKSFSKFSRNEKESILIKNQVLFMFNNVNFFRFMIFFVHFILTYPFTDNFQNFRGKLKNISNSILNMLKIKYFKK